MAHLNLDKLQIQFIGSATPNGPALPRCYTLTHSDQTGDLFLSIGTLYDQKAVSGWYTRLMRDEVLAAYRQSNAGIALHVFCHVSGGVVFGPAGWRYKIFKYHLPGVLEAFRSGDAAFLEEHPAYDQASIQVHFQSSKARYHRLENWGMLKDYTLSEVNHAI